MSTVIVAAGGRGRNKQTLKWSEGREEMTSLTPLVSPVKEQLRPQLKSHPFALHHFVNVWPWWWFALNVAALESQRRKEFQPAATSSKVQIFLKKRKKSLHRLSADSAVESKLMCVYGSRKSSRCRCGVTKKWQSSGTGTVMLTRCFLAEMVAVSSSPRGGLTCARRSARGTALPLSVQTH